MPKGERSKDSTQISISMPKKLLLSIDAEAEADNRSRSNWIVTELTAAVGLKRKLRGAADTKDFEVAGAKRSAPVGGSYSTSTRISPGAPLDVDLSDRLNEVPTQPRSQESSGPRARSTRPGIAKTVEPKKGKTGS